MSGYYDAILYVILASVSFVFLDDLCQDINPITALFVMSGIAIVCFNILGFKDTKKTYCALLNHRLLFLTMSVALGIDWLCMIYATYLSDPFITMTGLFISSAFFGFFKLYRATGIKTYLASMLCLVISIAVLCLKYEMQKTGTIAYGALLGTLAGGAFFIYMVTSDELCKRSNLSTIQVLATRFWVLFLGAALSLNLNDLYEALLNHGLALVIVSIASLVIPIYYNQQAIKKLGAATASTLTSLVPSVTYLIYAVWNKNIALTNVLICVIITFALLLPKLKSLYCGRRKRIAAIG